MPKITVDYFGFSGTGPTVKEAKQDAGRKIQALQNGYWTPKLVEWRGHAVLVYRDLTGWNKTFLQHPGGTLHIGGSSGGYEDEKEAMRAARRHVVDLGWEFGDALNLFPDWFPDERERREIIAGRQWQVNMKQLTGAGIENETARRMIAGLETLPEGLVLTYPNAR